MYYVSIFLQYASQYLKSRLTYRGDTLVELFSDLMTQGVNLVFILVVFNHTPLLKGWQREEIIFIYGFFLVPYAIFISLFNIWDFNNRYIVKGEMDRILTRPLHSLFQVILERMELESLFGAFTGLAVMYFAGTSLGLELAWYHPFIFIVMVLGGALIYAGVFISLAAIGFWSDSRTDIMPMIYNISNYGRYPVNIYNNIIRFILTWILPFAFVGVYPAAYFLKRQEWYVYSFLSPVMGAVFFTLAVIIWNCGVKKYRGAGN